MTNNNNDIRARFRAAKTRKQERVNHLVKVMKEEYENRTGMVANYVMVI